MYFEHDDTDQPTNQVKSERTDFCKIILLEERVLPSSGRQWQCCGRKLEADRLSSPWELGVGEGIKPTGRSTLLVLDGPR